MEISKGQAGLMFYGLFVLLDEVEGVLADTDNLLVTRVLEHEVELIQEQIELLGDYLGLSSPKAQ